MNSEGFSDEPKTFTDKDTLRETLKELLGDRFIPYREMETETDASEKPK